MFHFVSCRNLYVLRSVRACNAGTHECADASQTGGEAAREREIKLFLDLLLRCG